MKIYVTAMYGKTRIKIVVQSLSNNNSGLLIEEGWGHGICGVAVLMFF